MAGDSLYQSVSLLLKGDGANGFTTIPDRSPIPKAVSVLGDARISTTQSKFGGSSMYFDGTGDYLTVGAIADFKHLHDDTTDFAIEGWVYWTSGTQTLLSTAAGSADIGFFIGVNVTTGTISAQMFRGASGSYLLATSTTGLTSGAWTYFKFSYTKTTRAYAFRIGSADAGSGTMAVTGTWAASSTSNPSFVLAIARYQNATPGAYFSGYLDDLRITKAARTETSAPSTEFIAGMGQVAGSIKDSTSALCARIARAYRRDNGALVAQAYTQAGDSSIANVALLLHLDGLNGAVATTDASQYARSITFVGNAAISTTRSRFGVSSLALDGTGDYLTVPWSKDFSIEAGDFNIAMWVYRAASGVSHYLMSGRGAGTEGWEWRINATNYLQFFYTGGSSVTGAVAVPSGQWSLVEVNRSGTSMTLWIDGVAAGSGTVADGVASAATTLKIGCDNVGTTGFNGWVGEIRFTKGLSRNAVAYTPPTDRYPDNSLALGYYAFNTPTVDELNVIAYDNAVSGTYYNDQINRVIPA